MDLNRSDFRGTSRFELKSRLGEGAVGVVYEAVDRESNRQIALKTLRELSPEAILLLKSEFRSVQDLTHANLVRLGELFEEAGSWFFTMEFVNGTDFLRYVRPPAAHAPSAPGFDEVRLRDALVQLTRGLRVLHNAQKVHRDIKPQNVLVTTEGRVVILDFGILYDASNRPASAGSEMSGTCGYMAPEQVLGEALAPSADWYAVGVVLYEALTGRLPFEGSVSDILSEKVTREPDPPHVLAGAIPRDLDTLCVDLLRIDPRARPSGLEVLARLQAPLAPEDRLSQARATFVGRDEELRALDRAFADSRTGAVTAIVSGESGVGKSFLVRNFTEGLSARDRTVEFLSARCYERESVSYKAVDGIVDDLTRLLTRIPEGARASLLPEHVGMLGRVFPVLAQVPEVEHALGDLPTIVSQQELRARAFLALKELLVRVADRSPVVLQIEDLQWADADGLALLAEVMRPPDAPRLLLLATVRPVTERDSGVARAAGAVDIEGDVRQLTLSNLAPEEAQKLISELLGESADAEQLRAIADDAKGHPLFIDELVRQRSLRGGDAAPLKLDDALWVRVQTLEKPTRELLELVCVAGIPIAQEVTAQASGLDVAQIFPLVSSLREAHFARTSGMRREDTVEPYHDRVRETVLARVDLETRKKIHARLARALEATAQVDAETLAVHWSGAGDRDRALRYGLRAADEAVLALAFNRASRLYKSALALVEEGATGAQPRDLQAKLAEALTNAGRGAEAAETRLELAKGAPPLEALDLTRQAAEQFLCNGDFDRGAELLRGVLAVQGVFFPRSQISVIVFFLLARLALKLRGLGFRARKESELNPRDILRIDTIRSAGAGFATSDTALGAYYQTRSLLLALRVGELNRICFALGMEVSLSATGGSESAERTANLLRSLEGVSSAISSPQATAFTIAAGAIATFLQGRWYEARGPLIDAEERLRDRCVGVTFILSSVRTQLYRALMHLGDLDELAKRVPPTLREDEEAGNHYSSLNFRGGPMVLLGLAADEPERVRRELRESSAKLTRRRFLVQHYYCLLSEAQIDLYSGDALAALEGLRASWPALRRSMLLRVQAIRVGLLDQRARCAVAAAIVPGQPRAKLLAEARGYLERLRREDNSWARSLTPMLRASLAAAHGDEALAIEQLKRAVDVFDDARMALHAASARWYLGQTTRDRALVERAREWMAGQSIKDARKMARTVGAGFPERALELL
jgi:hypothetical protein